MTDFEHFNTVPPEERTEQNSQEQTSATEQTQATETSAQATTTETATTQETKPDEFFEQVKKRYNAEVKSDDEMKELFSFKDKRAEYETKLKDHDELKTSVEKYKKELEDTKTTFTSDFLSKPLIKQAYVASQLQEKHPNLDKDILAGLAMTDLDGMDDLEVIARERKLRAPKSPIENIRAVIKKEIGIEPDTKPEEWDVLAKTELEMKASDARERIKQLLTGVELPKVVTKEEREQAQTKFLEDKKKASEPIKATFSKFDEYVNGDFRFTTPDDFKATLPNMFDNMFIKGGLEINEQNLATAELLKKALFVEQNFSKMKEVIEKQTEARVKAEYDKLVHNDAPPNTATATDQGTAEDPNRPGVSKFFQSQGEGRATRL